MVLLVTLLVRQEIQEVQSQPYDRDRTTDHNRTTGISLDRIISFFRFLLLKIIKDERAGLSPTFNGPKLQL